MKRCAVAGRVLGVGVRRSSTFLAAAMPLKIHPRFGSSPGAMVIFTQRVNLKFFFFTFENKVTLFFVPGSQTPITFYPVEPPVFDVGTYRFKELFKNYLHHKLQGPGAHYENEK